MFTISRHVLPTAFLAIASLSVATAAEDTPLVGNTPAALSDGVRQLLDRAQQERQGPFGASKPFTTNDKGEIIGLSLREFRLRPGDSRAIGELKQLTHLDLSHTNISDADLRDLAPLAGLRELNLWETQVSDAGAATLSKMTALQNLKLGGTQITDAALASLGKTATLRRLDVSRCKITDAGIASLVELKKLASLKLSETAVTDAALRTLEGFTALQAVTLDETKVTAEGLARFAKHEGFDWIAIEHGVANELAKRVSVGDIDGVDGMLAIGLDLPHRGLFRTRMIIPHPETPQDTERQRRRFRVEWDWSDKGRDQILFAELSIRQGSAKAIEVGIVELP